MIDMKTKIERALQNLLIRICSYKVRKDFRTVFENNLPEIGFEVKPQEWLDSRLSKQRGSLAFFEDETNTANLSEKLLRENRSELKYAIFEELCHADFERLLNFPSLEAKKWDSDIKAAKLLGYLLEEYSNLKRARGAVRGYVNCIIDSIAHVSESYSHWVMSECGYHKAWFEEDEGFDYFKNLSQNIEPKALRKNLHDYVISRLPKVEEEKIREVFEHTKKIFYV
jgi:hypothetical protein